MMNPEAGAHSSSDKRGHTAFIRLNICAFHDHGDPDERDKKGLAFNYEGLKDFLGSKSIPLSRVRNMKIRKGKFLVITDSEQVFPLNDIDQYRNGSCTVCTDLTAEKADLSFGGVGSKEGYTTVLARTGLGLELFRDAGDRGDT